MITASSILIAIPFVLVICRAYTKMEKRKSAYKLKVLEREGYISEGTVEISMRLMD